MNTIKKYKGQTLKALRIKKFLMLNEFVVFFSSSIIQEIKKLESTKKYSNPNFPIILPQWYINWNSLLDLISGLAVINAWPKNTMMNAKKRLASKLSKYFFELVKQFFLQ